MNRIAICVSFYLFLLVNISCGGYLGNNKKEIDYALQNAGTNRGELEKVLLHYQSDSLKYEAACFFD